MVNSLKKVLLVALAVMMVITFMPNLGVAERAYADDKDGGMIQMDTPVTVSGNAGDRTVLTFETGDEFKSYKIYSINEGDGAPCAELWCNGEELLDDFNVSPDSNNFIYYEELTENSEYALILWEKDDNEYNYQVIITENQNCTLKFSVDENAYIQQWNDEEGCYDNKGQTLEFNSEEGQYGWPYLEACAKDGRLFKGWALSTDPTNVIDDYQDYVLLGDTEFVAVWYGKDGGELTLDTEEVVTGGEGDFTIFAFTPEEDGYYKFYSYNYSSDCDPYAELILNEEETIPNDDNGEDLNFSLTEELKAGVTYHFVAKAAADSAYSYKLMVTKVLAYNVKFIAGENAYILEEDGDQEESVKLDEKEFVIFEDESLPYLPVYAKDCREFKGWALSTAPTTVIENIYNYEVQADTVFVAVWGPTPTNKGDIVLDNEYLASGNGGEKLLFTFTPPEDGAYRFYSYTKDDNEDFGDPWAELCEDGKRILYDDDGAGNLNFSLVKELKKGKKYQFIVTEYYNVDGGNRKFNYYVKISKAKFHNVKFCADANSYFEEYDPATDGYVKIKEVCKDIPEGNILMDYLPQICTDNSNIRLKGWALSTDPNTIIEPYSYIVTGPAVFTAVWKQAYNVTFDANGGYWWYYGDDDEVHKFYTMEEQLSDIDQMQNIPTSDEGLFFAGWATTKDATVPNVSVDTVLTEGMTLYAVWTDKYDLNYAVVSGVTDKIYTGAAQIQENIKVSFGGWELDEDYYTISYSNNIKAGIATIVLIGKGSYEGTSKTITFKINPASIKGAAVTIPAGDYTSDGATPFTPAPTVTLGGKTLVNGTDYTVTYANNINAGTATVTVTGKGNYTDSASATFTIKAKPAPQPTPTPTPKPTPTPEPTPTPTPTPEPTPTPAPTPDPTKEMGKDGTAIGEGASAEAAEAAITAAKGDKDLKGSVYNKLQVKQSKVTKTSIKVAWDKISGAKKYVVYAGKSGKSNKLQKITTTTKTNYTLKKFNKKKLTKGTYYKFMVVALNSKGKVVTSSKFAHIATLGKNAASNPGKITTKAKKDKVTVKVKKTFKLAGAYAASSKKLKIKKVLGMRYESTNTKVATVSSKGVIKGVKKGTCYVYAYAQNGLAKKIKVTVKK